MNRLFSILFYTLLICFTSYNSAKTLSIELPPDEIAYMAGQMMLVGFRGMEANEDMKIVDDIRERNLGGIILFDYDVPNREAVRNISSPSQVERLISQLQSFAETPLFIAVDQEGGRVNRLKADYGFPLMPSAQDLGQGEYATTRQVSEEWGALLSNLGFNINFAPVADVNVNPENPIIGRLGRSFSTDEHIVTEHVAAFIEGHKSHGVFATIKHFPGHGSAWNDSHLGMADVSDTWQDRELVPFQTLVENGKVEMIMTAHIFNAHLDSDFPATLSQNVLTEKLRKDWGYEGIIISDDMQMKAITEYYGLEEALVLAINAGVDVLIFANNSVYEPDITERAISIIVENVKNGTIPQERIVESYERIMRVKDAF